MGWNGHFAEFVPVRYAEQSASEQRFFVRLRVDPQGVFIDALIVRGLSASNAELVLKSIRVGMAEEDPISDFKKREVLRANAGCPAGGAKSGCQIKSSSGTRGARGTSPGLERAFRRVRTCAICSAVRF